MIQAQYTLASWSQCAYQDNCANIMSATCRCGMSFVLHFALCTWASETSIVDGKTPMLILSRRRQECQRSIFHCPSSKAGHWIVPLLVKAWIVLPGQNFYWGLLSALGAGRSMLKSWTEPAVEPSVAVRRTTARVLSINTHGINVPGWPTIRWVWEVILGEGKYVWGQGLAGSRITTLTHSFTLLLRLKYKFMDGGISCLIQFKHSMPWIIFLQICFFLCLCVCSWLGWAWHVSDREGVAPHQCIVITIICQHFRHRYHVQHYPPALSSSISSYSVIIFMMTILFDILRHHYSP